MSSPRATLTMVQSARLIALIEAEYTTSDKSDDQFAAYATEKLGFPVIRRHITSRRDELGIPSHRESRAPVDHSAAITELRAMVAELTAKVETLHLVVEADRKDSHALSKLAMATEERLNHVVQVMKLQKHFREGKPV